MYNVRAPNTHCFQRNRISTVSPSLLTPLRWYWFLVTQCEKEEEVLGRERHGRVRVFFFFLVVFVCLSAFCLLHDADTAVELTLGVVVVDVGVAAAHVGGGHGGQAAGVVGAPVLEQYVRALLAPGSPSVGERCLAAGVSAFHIHAVLWKEMEGRQIRFKDLKAEMYVRFTYETNSKT